MEVSQHKMLGEVQWQDLPTEPGVPSLAIFIVKPGLFRADRADRAKK